jgi:TolB protein
MSPKGILAYSLLLLVVFLTGCGTSEAIQTLSSGTTEVSTQTLTPLPPAMAPTVAATLQPSPAEGEGMIAFYSHRDGNLENYTMWSDGSHQQRVTFNDYSDDSPALSPDGMQIAFVSNRDDPDPAACSTTCLYQLYLIGTDGSHERQLVDTAFSTLHPDWHPGGTRISFDTEFNLEGDIYVVNADGTGMQLLIEDGFWADWSPDGRRIAFARLEQRQILVMEADGSNEQQLTYMSNAENPTWSQDGIWIAFQSSADGDFEIYALNVEEALQMQTEAVPLQLTDNTIGDLWPSWRQRGAP